MPVPDEILARTLPGLAASVAVARSLTRGFLGDDPRADDALLIVSELATNAIRHSASRDGGAFELRLERKPQTLRIEVVDEGPVARTGSAAASDEAFAPGEDPSFPYGESGRGHTIVYALADDAGHEQHPDRALWWAELWTEQP